MDEDDNDDDDDNCTYTICTLHVSAFTLAIISRVITKIVQREIH
jgi:hypothetical protein